MDQVRRSVTPRGTISTDAVGTAGGDVVLLAVNDLGLTALGDVSGAGQPRRS
jgi:hypothetical protein